MATGRMLLFAPLLASVPMAAAAMAVVVAVVLVMLMLVMVVVVVVMAIVLMVVVLVVRVKAVTALMAATEPGGGVAGKRERSNGKRGWWEGIVARGAELGGAWEGQGPRWSWWRCWTPCLRRRKGPRPSLPW